MGYAYKIAYMQSVRDYKCEQKSTCLYSKIEKGKVKLLLFLWETNDYTVWEIPK